MMVTIILRLTLRNRLRLLLAGSLQRLANLMRLHDVGLRTVLHLPAGRRLRTCRMRALLHDTLVLTHLAFLEFTLPLSVPGLPIASLSGGTRPQCEHHAHERNRYEGEVRAEVENHREHEHEHRDAQQRTDENLASACCGATQITHLCHIFAVPHSVW